MTTLTTVARHQARKFAEFPGGCAVARPASPLPPGRGGAPLKGLSIARKRRRA